MTNRIQQLMESRGWSLATLAQHTGIDLDRLRALEGGADFATATEADALTAAQLDTPPPVGLGPSADLAMRVGGPRRSAR